MFYQSVSLVSISKTKTPPNTHTHTCDPRWNLCLRFVFIYNNHVAILFVFIGLVNSKLIQVHLMHNATILKSNLKPVLSRSFFFNCSHLEHIGKCPNKSLKKCMQCFSIQIKQKYISTTTRYQVCWCSAHIGRLWTSKCRQRNRTRFGDWLWDAQSLDLIKQTSVYIMLLSLR